MKAFISNNAVDKLTAVMCDANVSLDDQRFVIETIAKGLDAQSIGPVALATPCGKVFFVDMAETYFDAKAIAIARPDPALIKGLTDIKN